MSVIILFMAVILAVWPVHVALAQGVEEKAKGEADGQNEPETGDETKGPVLKLKGIVVTGDKIGRLAGEAPPSITIVEGEEAEQPINRHIKMILRKAANVFVEEGIQLPSIRGIDGSGGGRQAITAGVQPRIPILIDDAPRPLNNSFSISRSSTWDVSSMEIARGPQPSSTGRNALGGAIRIYTNDPGFEYAAAARLRGFTADGTIDGAAMVNLPLIDNQVALRATLEESRGNAYIDVTDEARALIPGQRDVEEELYQRYRGKLLFTPEAIPGLQVKFNIDHMRTEGPIPGFAQGNGDPKDFTIPVVKGASPEIQDAGFGLQSAFEENDQTTYTGRTNYVLSEFAELELRGSFINNNLLFADTGVGFGELSYDLDQVEGEGFLRLSDLGVLKRGLVGVIHNTSTEEGVNPNPFFGIVSDGEINNTGWYGEAEIALGELGLADGLTLIAGGRYERDDRHRSIRYDINFPPFPMAEVVSEGGFSARRFLPKVGLRYAPTNELTLGYTYSESFRAGGIDVDPFPVPAFARFDPESLSQHEVYAKSAVLNRRVSLAASAFYYTYEDAQIPGASQVMTPFGSAFLFGNVPEAVGYGLELEATADLMAGFSLNGALGLLKTEITDAGPVLRATNEGGSLPRAPGTTASLALNYAPGYGFNASLSGRFVGRTTSGLNQPSIPSYTIFDLSAGYEFQQGYFGGFRVDLFIENLTDQGYFTFRERVDSGFAVNALEGKGRPHTFGFSSTWRF